MANPNGIGGFKKGQSGNKKGRPRKPELEAFRDALGKLEKKTGKSLIEHAVGLAYVNKDVLIAIIRKMIPDLSAVDVKGLTFQDIMSELRKNGEK